MTGKLETFRVVARLRPPTAVELEHDTVVNVSSSNSNGEQQSATDKYNRIQVTGPRPGWYQFDRVFDCEGDQQSVFEETGAPIVAACCDGYNGAIFAYGQTGTGKTHTMLGCDVWNVALNQQQDQTNDTDSPPDETCRKLLSRNRGLIPRAMSQILQYCASKPLAAKPVIKVSYLEIYNDKVFDLLNYEESKENKSGLEIREDKLQGVVVPDAVQVPVASMQDLLNVLWEGAQNRAISATDMNLHSSRSHTIFQVVLEQHITGSTSTLATSRGMGRKPSASSSHMVKRSKLSLVDLAGSEKWRSHQLTSFSEKRIQEMTCINQSLSCLGNVVRGLLDPGRSHIPYRNSKLTRLLQDSLGGNTKTSFIVTLAGSELSLEETLSTLQFADRAKQVEIHPTLNEQPDDASTIRRLEVEVQRLRQALQARRNSPRSRDSSLNELQDKLAEAQSQVHREIARCTALARALQSRGGRSNAKAVEVQNLDRGALKLAPRLTEFQATVSGDASLAPSRVELLEKYHGWLRHHKLDSNSLESDSLAFDERLSLMEWSVLIQASELEQALRRFDREKKALEAECMMKDQKIQQLERQLRTSRMTAHQTFSKIMQSTNASPGSVDYEVGSNQSSCTTRTSFTFPESGDDTNGEYNERCEVKHSETYSDARKQSQDFYSTQTVKQQVLEKVERDKLRERAAWTTLLDPKTNRNYYYNRVTKETTWSLPQGITVSNPTSNQLG